MSSRHQDGADLKDLAAVLHELHGLPIDVQYAAHGRNHCDCLPHCRLLHGQSILTKKKKHLRATTRKDGVIAY
ncbi:hypothetical protein ACLUYC_06630 [Limosilactobacillus mucosae]